MGNLFLFAFLEKKIISEMISRACSVSSQCSVIMSTSLGIHQQNLKLDIFCQCTNSYDIKEYGK